MVGRRRVIVRVLNNAMQGGLRGVALVDARLARRPSHPPVSTPGGFEPVESRRFRGRMPGARQPCAFTVWADSQSGWPTFERIVGLIAKRAGAFSAGVGDLVSDGSNPDEWPRFVETLAPLAERTAIVPIPGNHDYDGSYNELRAAAYEEWFSRKTSTWFAWSCGPVRLVALDLNREFPIGISEESRQWAWLQAEVRSVAWKSAGWRIVLVHQPPWSRSWAGYAGDEAVRRIVEPLVRDNELNVVLSGHSHAYEYLHRSVDARVVHVLVTGGAGGSLEAPQPEVLGRRTTALLSTPFSVREGRRTGVDVRSRGRERCVIRLRRSRPCVECEGCAPAQALNMSAESDAPSLLDTAALFLRLGTTAFGGPAAHIAMMEDEVVRRRRWLSHQQFLDYVAATNFIPGPNSTELAIHIGTRAAAGGSHRRRRVLHPAGGADRRRHRLGLRSLRRAAPGRGRVSGRAPVVLAIVVWRSGGSADRRSRR